MFFVLLGLCCWSCVVRVVLLKLVLVDFVVLHNFGEILIANVSHSLTSGLFDHICKQFFCLIFCFLLHSVYVSVVPLTSFETNDEISFNCLHLSSIFHVLVLYDMIII